MGWDGNHTLLTQPILDADLSIATGVGGPVYDLGAMISGGQSSGYVNKWAKYKGVDCPTIGVLTDAIRKQYNWGMDCIPIWSGRIQKMVNYWLGIDTSSGNWPICGNVANFWKNQVPSSWFRYLDFDGYKPGAQAPISPLTSGSISVSLSGDVRVEYPTGARDSYTLKFDDFDYDLLSGADMYVGMLLYGTVGNVTYIYYKTDSQKVSQSWGPGIVSIGGSGGSNDLFGSWRVFPFLSSVPVTTLSSNMSLEGTFVALLPYQDITISRRYAEFTLTLNSATNHARIAAHRIYYDFTLANTMTNVHDIITQAVILIEFLDSSDNVLASKTETIQSVAASSSENVVGFQTFSASFDILSLNAVRISVQSMSQSYISSHADTKTITWDDTNL